MAEMRVENEWSPSWDYYMFMGIWVPSRGTEVISAGEMIMAQILGKYWKQFGKAVRSKGVNPPNIFLGVIRERQTNNNKANRMVTTSKSAPIIS